MNTTAPKSAQRGLTLIEAGIVAAIAAVLVGAALPSFQQARERRHLEGLAAQLRTDIAHARSLAVARNQSVRLGLAAGSCYVLHTGAAGACSCSDDGKASCKGDATLLRHEAFTPGSGVRLSSNSTSMVFDGQRGTVSPTGTIKLTGSSGAAIHTVVNIMGRARHCSPAPALPGYPKC